MAGQLIELPKRLEWKPVDTWVGVVSGTQLCTKAEAMPDGRYSWSAWDGRILVNAGTAKDLGEARRAAEEALKAGVLIVRVLPQGA